MSIIGTIYEDVTTEVLGSIGPWQFLVTLLATLLMLPTMFNQYTDMLLLTPADVFCVSPVSMKDASLCYKTMYNGTEVLKCNRWQIKLLWFIRLKKTWLVFCDEKLKMLSISVISQMGLIFGFIIFGMIADSLGRKKSVIISVVAEIVFGLGLVFCDSEGWFRLTIFLKSLFGSAISYIGIIIICEIASNSWRTWLCSIVMIPKLLAMICTVPLSNSAPNIETYLLIACMYCICCLIILRWTPESPQWLLYNKNITIAEKMLFNAAKMNGVRLCNDFKIRPVNHRAYYTLDQATTCIGILKSHNNRITFFICTSFWMLYRFLWSSFYIRLYSEAPASNIAAKVCCYMILLGCLTILSCLKLTLKRILLLHIVIAGVFSASVIFFYKGTIHNCLSSIAVASGLIGHTLIMNITPRLFALNIRATVVGYCHATGQLGSIVSVLIFFFEPLNDQTLIGIELGTASVLIALCLVLPDVDKRELPDVFEDMDYFSELSKPLRWVSLKTSSISREETIMRIYSFGSNGRSMSLSSNIGQRVPAKPIGFTEFWRICIMFVHQFRPTWLAWRL